MNKNNEIMAGEWFQKAEHDFGSARLIIDCGEYADTAAVLLEQAVEKYLKGYLISKGWQLIKTHNLKYLLDEAVGYDKRFKDYYDMAIQLTGYYIDEKYPPIGFEVALEEVKVIYKRAGELIDIVLDPTAARSTIKGRHPLWEKSNGGIKNEHTD